MANVNILFNGKEFLLSCEDGQEEHLQELSTHLNEKFDNLKIYHVKGHSKKMDEHISFGKEILLNQQKMHIYFLESLLSQALWVAGK